MDLPAVAVAEMNALIRDEQRAARRAESRARAKRGR